MVWMCRLYYLSGSYASFELTTRRISDLDVWALCNDGDRIAPDARFGGDPKANEV